MRRGRSIRIDRCGERSVMEGTDGDRWKETGLLGEDR